jgi:predicted transcriptional regulator
MAPIEFKLLTLTGKKFIIQIDDSATVLDLAEEIAKRTDIPLRRIYLKMRGAREPMDKVQDKVLKDVDYIRNKKANNSSDILLMIISEKSPPLFRSKDSNIMVCGGKRRKTRRSKKSRKTTRRRR